MKITSNARTILITLFWSLCGTRNQLYDIFIW